MEEFVMDVVMPTLDTLRDRFGAPENLFTVHSEKTNSPTQFVLVKDLAGGASARIYKSYYKSPHNEADSSTLQPIAIKRILASTFRDYEDEFQQLLRREKFALQEMSRYPHMFTEYYGCYYHEVLDEHWLAISYCDGGSIYGLTKEAVNLKLICAIAAGCVRGLEAMHNIGFIHGDIKSGNILIQYPGLVKICDFGLASKVKGVRKPDLHALGTLDYQSPETMMKSLALDHDDPNANKYMYDYRTDIWALGVVILELLLGRTPMQELRRVDQDEFAFYLASMCKPNKRQNLGSGLGYFFYYPRYHENLMRESATPLDRDLLCERVPELKNNKHHLLELLMRPNMHDKTPNPKIDVPKPKVQKLFMINKCLDFIGQCLFIRYKMRPTSTTIQKHPFIRSACSELKKLEPKMDKLVATYKKWGERKKIWSKYQCGLTIHEIHNVLERQKQREKDKLFNETL